MRTMFLAATTEFMRFLIATGSGINGGKYHCKHGESNSCSAVSCGHNTVTGVSHACQKV